MFTCVSYNLPEESYIHCDNTYINWTHTHGENWYIPNHITKCMVEVDYDSSMLYDMIIVLSFKARHSLTWLENLT